MVQQSERRFVNEFLQEHYAFSHYQTRVWLGPVPPGEDARMFQVIGKWVDAIVFGDGEIILIEAKLQPTAEAIGQLQMYEQEFKVTLRFQRYWGQPIRKVLVTTRVDDAVQGLAKQQGIEYVVFAPEWIKYVTARRLRL